MTETIDNEILLINYWRACRALMANDREEFEEADTKIIYILKTCKLIKEENDG